MIGKLPPYCSIHSHFPFFPAALLLQKVQWYLYSFLCRYNAPLKKTRAFFSPLLFFLSFSQMIPSNFPFHKTNQYQNSHTISPHTITTTTIKKKITRRDLSVFYCCHTRSNTIPKKMWESLWKKVFSLPSHFTT